MLAWDNKKRSALNVSSFKVFEQPLELTNRGEVNNGEMERGGKTMRRGGDENGGAQALCKSYVLMLFVFRTHYNKNQRVFSCQWVCVCDMLG